MLADPGRLRILSLIQAQPGNEACVCHLTDALDVLQPTVSHHLRVLFEAGLVERERRGNWVYYRTIPGALESIRVALGQPPDRRDPTNRKRTEWLRVGELLRRLPLLLAPRACAVGRDRRQ